MKFAETELRQITEDTWRIVLGEDLEPSHEALTPGTIPDPIAACMQIAGDWQLAVVVYCSVALARHAAGLMFGTEGDDANAEDVNDTMCELVNIIGGNVKGVLSGTSHLSLPNLVKGQDFKLMFPRHVPLGEAGFMSQGQPILVVVLGEDRAAGGARERRSAS